MKSPRTASPPAEPPIMVRVRITRGEWTELQKLALDRGTAAADLIAAALRGAYNLQPEGNTTP